MSISIRTLDRPELLEVHLQGTFDDEDVEKFDELLATKLTGVKVRLLLLLEDFEGWDTLKATWDSLRLMRHHREDIERLAAVVDRDWQGVAVQLGGSLATAATRVFSPEELSLARTWLHASDAEDAEGPPRARTE